MAIILARRRFLELSVLMGRVRGNFFGCCKVSGELDGCATKNWEKRAVDDKPSVETCILSLTKRLVD